jgi:hypothetical protein
MIRTTATIQSAGHATFSGSSLHQSKRLGVIVAIRESDRSWQRMSSGREFTTLHGQLTMFGKRHSLWRASLGQRLAAQGAARSGSDLRKSKRRPVVCSLATRQHENGVWKAW